MQDILSAMQWRYATKQYDATKQIPEADLETILEATRLAPSSYGLPVWKIVLPKDATIRAKLREAGYGQSAFTDASALVVFAVKTDLDAKAVNDFMALVAKTRGIDVSALEGYRGMLQGSIDRMSPEQRVTWAAKQAYLALGITLETAALLQVDATPMEGFNPAAFDEILGLKEQNLTTVVVAALGYRDAADSYIALKKVRETKDEVRIVR